MKSCQFALVASKFSFHLNSKLQGSSPTQWPASPEKTGHEGVPAANGGLGGVQHSHARSGRRDGGRLLSPTEEAKPPWRGTHLPRSKVDVQMSTLDESTVLLWKN